ncbi:hypothetical protein [Microcystis wesenbergii]|uniref:hypothetical protein n=1 Tax=Microcystis wesenbergii TaxID=44823 RepID=UPI001680FD52|nr:hypothetical protein [Microcystis wesenbergii]MBD2118949.1 hypothetical protein [Microcystis wesenbergii FACHB-1339]
MDSKGWKIGTFSDFLELTPEEIILIEIKLALPSVSLELLLRLLLATGATPQVQGVTRRLKGLLDKAHSR